MKRPLMRRSRGVYIHPHRVLDDLIKKELLFEINHKQTTPIFLYHVFTRRTFNFNVALIQDLLLQYNGDMCGYKNQHIGANAIGISKT